MSEHRMCFWCEGAGLIAVPSFLPYDDPDIRHLLDAYCASETLRTKLDKAAEALSGAGVNFIHCPWCGGSGHGDAVPCGKPALDPRGGQPIVWPPPDRPGDFPGPSALLHALADEYVGNEAFRREIDGMATD
jgi:hypothetical protein